MIWFKIRNAFVEDKRRLENRITQLEEEIEDEQNNNEQNNEKLRKIQSDYEKLMADLHLEKSNVAKAEVNIIMFFIFINIVCFKIFKFIWSTIYSILNRFNYLRLNFNIKA